MALYKIWASRVNNAEAAEFEGDLGQIWYDETTGNLRLYTGVPGGEIINGSGGSGNASLPLSNGTSNFNIATANGNATITVNGFSDTAVFGVNSLAINGVLTATGNVVGGNILTGGYLDVTGNTTSGNFIGAFNGSGANVTAISATNISSGTLAQARLANAAVTLGSTALTLGATVTTVAGLTSLTSTTFVGALTGAATTAGTVTTAAQPNITSVGTLTSVTVTGNVSGGNLITAGRVDATGNVSGGNLITAGNLQAGNLIVSGIEAVTTLNVSGDTTIVGNLTVSGTTFTANVANIVITDPILGLGRGANGDPLTSNDGLDRGIEMFYYTDAEQIAFMGFDNNEGKMISASNVSIANNIVTVNSYGTTVVGALEGASVSVTGNIIANSISSNNISSHSGNIPVTGNLTPTANIAYNIGSSTLRWNELYLAGNSIYLGNVIIKNLTGNVVEFFESDGTTPAELIARGNLSNTIISSLGVGTAASGNVGEIRATNNITAFFSDRRLKEITGNIPDAIDKVVSLSGIQFTNNDRAAEFGYTSRHPQVGVIAQEVQQVLPEAVVPAPFDIAIDANGKEISRTGENYLAVQYDKIIPLLIEAIKQQQFMIRALQQRMD